jgi:hypothetical protein
MTIESLRQYRAGMSDEDAEFYEWFYWKVSATRVLRSIVYWWLRIEAESTRRIRRKPTPSETP